MCLMPSSPAANERKAPAHKITNSSEWESFVVTPPTADKKRQREDFEFLENALENNVEANPAKKRRTQSLRAPTSNNESSKAVNIQLFQPKLLVPDHVPNSPVNRASAHGSMQLEEAKIQAPPSCDDDDDEIVLELSDTSTPENPASPSSPLLSSPNIRPKPPVTSLPTAPAAPSRKYKFLGPNHQVEPKRMSLLPPSSRKQDAEASLKHSLGELVFNPSRTTPEILSEYEDFCRSVAGSHKDYIKLDRAYQILHKCNYSLTKAKETVLKNPAALYSSDEWCKEEIQIFKAFLSRNKKDFTILRNYLPTKTLGQIIDYYYRTKHVCDDDDDDFTIHFQDNDKSPVSASSSSLPSYQPPSPTTSTDSVIATFTSNSSSFPLSGFCQAAEFEDSNEPFDEMAAVSLIPENYDNHLAIEPMNFSHSVQQQKNNASKLHDLTNKL